MIEQNFKIFKTDFMVGIDVSKFKTMDEIKNQLNYLIIDGINVGSLYQNLENLLSLPMNPLLEQMIPEQKFINVSDITDIDYNFERNVLHLFNDISFTSSTKDKEEKVKIFYNNLSPYKKEMFIKIINLTYSTFYTYNVTLKILETAEDVNFNYIDFESIILLLSDIGLNDHLPKHCKTVICDIYSKASDVQKQLIKLIIDRDFKIKLSEKSFWNIFGSDLIKLTPYQRCEKMDQLKKLQYPCISQLKADGKFNNIIFDPNYFGFSLNRSGKQSHLTKTLMNLYEFNNDTKYFDNIWNCPITFHGEAVIKYPNETIINKSSIEIKVLDRATGNGLLNSYGDRFNTFKNLVNEINDVLKSKSTTLNKKVQQLCQQLLEWHTVEKNLVMQIWNMVPFEEWKNLETTFTVSRANDYVVDFIKHYNQWLIDKNLDAKITVIHTEYSNSEDEVMEKYVKWLKLGYEGQIAKNLSAVIKHGTCTDGIIKLKDFKECDLRIVGYVPGTDLYVGGVGSYMCESECGKLKVNVAGITQDLRGFMRVDENNSALGIMLKPGWDNNCNNGRIINVKFNMLSKDKFGNYSLSLPSFVEFRDDVVVAETLEEIKKKKSGGKH